MEFGRRRLSANQPPGGLFLIFAHGVVGHHTVQGTFSKADSICLELKRQPVGQRRGKARVIESQFAAPESSAYS
jgi:hypothetical protein